MRGNQVLHRVRSSLPFQFSNDCLFLPDGGDIVITEPENHTLAGAGLFATPTLHGPFEIAPPYDGDCVTKPVTRATFAAEVVLYRYPRGTPKPPGIVPTDPGARP